MLTGLGGLFGAFPGDDDGAGDGYTGTGGDLFSIISGGEGGVDSVNRGKAGDTPDGIKSILGKTSSELTVDEVSQAQTDKKIFAAGKYQITPNAMSGFKDYLKRQGVDTATTMFNEKTQDMYRQYVINEKRPEVGKYLSGEGVSRRNRLS